MDYDIAHSYISKHDLQIVHQVLVKTGKCVDLLPGQHRPPLELMQTSHFWDFPEYLQIELQKIYKDYNYWTLLNTLLIDNRISLCPSVLMLW